MESKYHLAITKLCDELEKDYLNNEGISDALHNIISGNYLKESKEEEEQ